MKAKITNVKFLKEFESKFGTLYQYLIEYDGKKAYYSSKTKEQKKFVIGQEAEFTEEEKMGTNDTPYTVIKPAQSFQNSGYGKAIRKEQSKYSGFALSYAKDLCVAGKIELSQMTEYTKKMFNLMVELDKSIEQ